MDRTALLKQKVQELYEAKNPGRADWADWLYENHIFVVTGFARQLADRYHAQKDLCMAAAMLHDIADVAMKRDHPRHQEESEVIARKLLRETGFSAEETRIVVDDAMRFHSCHNGESPQTLEGKILAGADALAHLKTDFYKHFVSPIGERWMFDEVRGRVLPKIERDFNRKILFDDLREETRSHYEALKVFFAKQQ